LLASKVGASEFSDGIRPDGVKADMAANVVITYSNPCGIAVRCDDEVGGVLLKKDRIAIGGVDSSPRWE